MAEAFFSSLKSELADRFTSGEEATRELFDYIEVFYNQRRRHSTLGYVSPAAFERAHATREAAAIRSPAPLAGIPQAAPTDDRRSWAHR